MFKNTVLVNDKRQKQVASNNHLNIEVGRVTGVVRWDGAQAFLVRIR